MLRFEIVLDAFILKKPKRAVAKFKVILYVSRSLVTKLMGETGIWELVSSPEWVITMVHYDCKVKSPICTMNNSLTKLKGCGSSVGCLFGAK